MAAIHLPVHVLRRIAAYSHSLHHVAACWLLVIPASYLPFPFPVAHSAMLPPTTTPWKTNDKRFNIAFAHAADFDSMVTKYHPLSEMNR